MLQHRGMLLEDDQGEFIVDKQYLSETKKSGATDITLLDIPGRFSVCDTINGNGRRYSRAVWERQLDSKSTLMQLIEARSCFGQLEHPSDGIVTLSSPISHMVTGVRLTESGEVLGSLRILNTPDGRKLAAMIEAGYNPRVSSRGFGSVNNNNGVSDVADDYVCEGWDIVHKPSCVNAILSVPRQTTTESSETHLQQRYESLDLFVKDDSLLCLSERLGYKSAQEAWAANPILPAGAKLSESAPSATPVSSQHQPEESKPDQTMPTIEQIQENVRALIKDPSTLSAAAVTETLRTCEALHNEVAQIVAATPAKSWEGTKLHDSISAVEASIHAHLERPKQDNVKLTEDNAKLLRIVKTLAETANAYKKRLADSQKRCAQYESLTTELTRRGRGWKARAESVSLKEALATKRFHVCAESLDTLTEMHKTAKARYNEDTMALSKHVIASDCSEALKDPAIKKALDEAVTLQEVARVRVGIEKAKKAVNEQSGAAPAKPAKSIKESSETAKPLYTTVRTGVANPSMSLEESVGIANRLSGR